MSLDLQRLERRAARVAHALGQDDDDLARRSRRPAARSVRHRARLRLLRLPSLHRLLQAPRTRWPRRCSLLAVTFAPRKTPPPVERAYRAPRLARQARRATRPTRGRRRRLSRFADARGRMFLSAARPESGKRGRRRCADLFGAALVYTECCGLYPRQVGDSSESARLRDRARRRGERAARRRARRGVRPRARRGDAGRGGGARGGAARCRAGAREEPQVRYHDPCRASRGRAVTTAPRTVLERALGRAPDEFSNHHAESACSRRRRAAPGQLPGDLGRHRGRALAGA